MSLTPAQLQTLKTAILADQTAAALYENGDLSGLTAHMNAPASPAKVVWKTSVRTVDIFDQIAWANMTPTGSPGADAAWTNRSLACQGKQFNLQTILVGRETIDPSKNKVRNGLEDALTDIPSGNNGNLQQAGWTGVRAQFHRNATRLEALFATGAGTDVDPGKLGSGQGGAIIEGAVSYTLFIGM